MSSRDIESEIDALYQLDPRAFTAARTALQRTLKGADAARVKALKKPLAAPLAVNYLYWKARPIYDRLLTAGRALRAAQVGALTGKAADVRRATETHRAAVGEAVRTAMALAAESGVNPGADLVGRMLEALSLLATPPERPGRFTGVLQPAAFEALAGVTVATPPAPPAEAARTAAAAHAGTHPRATAPASDRAAERHQAERTRDEARHAEAARRQAEAERRASEAEVQAAERVLARARDAEARVRRELTRAEAETHAADAALAGARARLRSLAD